MNTTRKQMPEKLESSFRSVHALVRLWREVRLVRAQSAAATESLRARVEALEDEVERVKSELKRVKNPSLTGPTPPPPDTGES